MWAANFPDPDSHLLTIFGPKKNNGRDVVLLRLSHGNTAPRGRSGPFCYHRDERMKAAKASPGGTHGSSRIITWFPSQ